MVAELGQIFTTFKTVAFAEYGGLSVAELQELRRTAREQGVVIKVVKNRLVRVAMSQNEALKDTDTSLMKGQVLYAISDEDEVLPAKLLAEFASKHPEMKLVSQRCHQCTVGQPTCIIGWHRRPCVCII